MMSLESIHASSRRAARRSAARGITPAIFEKEDIAAARAAMAAGYAPRLSIPFIGDRRPRGYKATSNMYSVDSSGFGRPGEAALTTDEFVDNLKAGHAYAIVEAGQFQVYVQEYTVNKRKGA